MQSLLFDDDDIEPNGKIYCFDSQMAMSGFAYDCCRWYRVESQKLHKDFFYTILGSNKVKREVTLWIGAKPQGWKINGYFVPNKLGEFQCNVQLCFQESSGSTTNKTNNFVDLLQSSVEIMNGMIVFYGDEFTSSFIEEWDTFCRDGGYSHSEKYGHFKKGKKIRCVDVDGFVKVMHELFGGPKGIFPYTISR